MTVTKVVKLNPKAIDQRLINEAAGILEKGGLVCFPTETVYGLGANLLNHEAVEALIKIKNRPDNKQFSIHIGNKNDVDKYAVNILPRAYKMMDKFWPGPLTIILAAPHEKSIGLRLPKNDVALRLLQAVDFPVIAPSANLSGHPAPQDAASVLKDLDGKIDFVLDGGPTEFGKESTVLDARVLPFCVLREGFLKKEEVLKVAAEKTVLFVCTGNSCRSVMAEFLLKKKLADIGRHDIEAISAGTFAFLGLGPTRETQRLIFDEIGADAGGHHAQRISEESVRKSDLILVMERYHRDEIIRQFPQAASRVHLLGGDNEIEDPIGKSEEFYKMTFLKIKEAVWKLIDTL